MMKLIPLSQGLFAQVDDEDYEEINQYKWSADKRKNTFYTTRKALVDNKWKNLKIHRVVMGITDPNIQCDHIDRNGLNNQKSNLRIVSGSNNMINQGLRANNKTGYKGVCYNNRDKKYLSQISFDNKTYSYSFDNPIDAAIKYNEMALKFYGEYAFLNELI